MSATADRVRDALTAPLAVHGVDLEDVSVERAGRRHVVRVVVDRDGGVDLDTVAEVSRVVSALLDESPLDQVVPGPFVLEVTSPGVDRPLTAERHWRRAIGRLVTLELADGTELTGRVVSVDGTDEAADAEVVVSTPTGDRQLRRNEIRRGVVQVEFTRADESEASEQSDGGTDDDSGADDAAGR